MKETWLIHISTFARVLSLAFGLIGIWLFLYYWDPSRLLVKRFQAKSPEIYEKIPPHFMEINPTDFISFHNTAKTVNGRTNLLYAIWGKPQQPLDQQPIASFLNFKTTSPECPGTKREYLVKTLDCTYPLYVGMKNLIKIDRLKVPISPYFKPEFTHFQPKKSNGRLVLYHNGYASTYHAQWRHIQRLVEKGYAVMAFDMFGYGGAIAGIDWKTLKYPMRPFFEPVVVALNYATTNFRYKSIDMIGLSAGGWITAVVAALDDRIRRSYPVSGVYPMYLRNPEREVAEPQLYKPMLKAASYLDMFVLASLGEGRRQVQIFNQYDRCCFRNRFGKLYEKAVQETVRSIGPGDFRVIIDTTHARHKISRYAFEAILKDIEAP